MTDPNILIVEDDSATAAAVSRALQGVGFGVTTATSLSEAMARLKARTPNVIVLDRLLPEGDSIDWIDTFRAAAPGAMVLVLSALGQASSRIEGLDQGADDYLAKPFEPDELTARVRALLRRADGADTGDEVLNFADLHIRVKARTLHVRDEHIPLSPREFDLLVYFARNHENVITRMQLLEHVWNLHFDPQTNVVDVHVGRLRRKIEAVLGHPPIHTVRGIGYVFELRPAEKI